MKRKKYIPLAITMLLAVPAFLTSCQEDAPEINYTMSVSVINDFTKVVEAIDRGALKNEKAIAKLADAIDRMSSDQQAIRDVLGSVNTAFETRLRRPRGGAQGSDAVAGGQAGPPGGGRQCPS